MSMFSGRLNMLVNVCRKQLTDIFAQFKPMEPKEPVSMAGSLKMIQFSYNLLLIFSIKTHILQLALQSLWTVFSAADIKHTNYSS